MPSPGAALTTLPGKPTPRSAPRMADASCVVRTCASLRGMLTPTSSVPARASRAPRTALPQLAAHIMSGTLINSDVVGAPGGGGGRGHGRARGADAAAKARIATSAA